MTTAPHIAHALSLLFIAALFLRLLQTRRALKHRDREWLEALAPNNTDTAFGRYFNDPASWKNLRMAELDLQRETDAFFTGAIASLRATLVRLMTKPSCVPDPNMRRMVLHTLRNTIINGDATMVLVHLRKLRELGGWDIPTPGPEGFDMEAWLECSSALMHAMDQMEGKAEPEHDPALTDAAQRAAAYLAEHMEPYREHIVGIHGTVKDGRPLVVIFGGCEADKFPAHIPKTWGGVNVIYKVDGAS